MKDPVALGWAIERASKTRLEHLANQAGVSAAVYLERVIAHLDEELTEDELPIWWPENDEELPINSS